MKKKAKKLVLTVFYCINSYLATWKIVYRSVSLWIITWGLSRPSLASLQGFLQEYHRQKGQKSSFSCILSLYTHPAKGCRMNSNSLMGLFDYFWVTSQYALPRLGWNGNSRAFNRRSVESRVRDWKISESATWTRPSQTHRSKLRFSFYFRFRLLHHL